jgi:CBS domain-containing protein
MARNISVFGIYPSQAAVEEAVASLRAAGFRNTDVSVLLPENPGSKDLAHEKHTKAPEGATTGAASGAVIGGALGWLAGIGALAIPGIGPFIAAGPIIAMLAGIGAGGAAGGMLGALVGLGIPEYEAKRYEGRIRKGGILLSVHSDNSDWARKAETILEQTGGEDISSTSESRADFAESDKPIPRHTTALSEAADRVRTSGGVSPTRPTNLRARDVMSTDVEFIEADRTLADAADRMRAAGVGFLPVREAGLIVGVVTDRDITVRGTAPGYDPRATPVRSVMTSEYAYCLENDGVSEIARTMQEKQIKRMLVLDGQKRLVGVISMGDIANYVGKEPLYT